MPDLVSGNVYVVINIDPCHTMPISIPTIELIRTVNPGDKLIFIRAYMNIYRVAYNVWLDTSGDRLDIPEVALLISEVG